MPHYHVAVALIFNDEGRFLIQRRGDLVQRFDLQAVIFFQPDLIVPGDRDAQAVKAGA